MQGLKHWLEQQFEERTVEPNSSLGKALQYLLTHWQTLTRFLEVPGAPLENNTAERALKLAIRQRKNSLFYATDYSAYIASILTSLIATCLQAEVNALDYLVALQEHRPAVFRRSGGVAAMELPHAPGTALAQLVANRRPSRPAGDGHSRARWLTRAPTGVRWPPVSWTTR